MEMTPEEVEARKAKVEAFLKAYAEVSKAHKLDFRAKIKYEQWGIVPGMEVFDLPKDVPKAQE